MTWTDEQLDAAANQIVHKVAGNVHNLASQLNQLALVLRQEAERSSDDHVKRVLVGKAEAYEFASEQSKYIRYNLCVDKDRLAGQP